MAGKHYHVLMGLQGLYMPNANYPTETLAGARSLALDEKRDWNDGQYEWPRQERDFMCGNIRKDGCYQSDHESIEIHGCYEDDCWCKCDELLDGEGYCEECHLVA